MRLDWSLTTAYNFGEKDESYKLRIEEAEDGLSMTVEQLKSVDKTKAPDSVKEQVDSVKTSLLTALDQLRKLRTNLKSMT